MSTRTDPPKQQFGGEPGTSPGVHTPRPLEVAPPPEPAVALPAEYGVPALELLMVDPANVFISWEITAEQRDAALAALGGHFGRRKLKIEIAAQGSGDALATAELFGDVGRWFMAVPPVGLPVTALLYFEGGQERFPLLTAGPVALPRVTPVEPDSFEELHVSYGMGPGRRLSLAGITRAVPRQAPDFDAAWLTEATGVESFATRGPGSVPGSFFPGRTISRGADDD